MSIQPPFCTYISRHPSGWFYAGKGNTASVLAGRYKGSGVLITTDFVAQLKCANLDTGGRRTNRHESTKTKIGIGVKAARALEDKLEINRIYSKARNQPEEKEIRIRSIREAKASVEHRQMMSEVARAACARPEVQKKKSDVMKEKWADPLWRAGMLAGMLAARKKT